MTDPLIVELRDVVKTYPGPPAVEALRGVSVSIAAGEHVAVVATPGPLQPWRVVEIAEAASPSLRRLHRCA